MRPSTTNRPRRTRIRYLPPAETPDNVAAFYDPNDPIQKMSDERYAGEPPLRFPEKKRHGRWYRDAEKYINGRWYKMVNGRIVEIPDRMLDPDR
jgi:hypothetical protein